MKQYAITALVAVGLVGTIGIGSAVAGVGPAGDFLDGPGHELLAFDATAPQCTDSVSTNSSTSIENPAGATEITHAQNVRLPDPSYSVGDPSFERVNESTYVLSVPTEEGDGMAAQCIASSRYEASMRIPVDDEPWTVVVEHDDETAMTLSGDSNSSGASGSASAGGQVSAAGSDGPEGE